MTLDDHSSLSSVWCRTDHHGWSAVSGHAQALREDAGIFIRPLIAADITPRYLSWFDDAQVTRFLEAKHLKAEDALEFLEWGLKNGLRHMFAVCDAKTGLHIGNVKLGDFNLKSGTSDLVTVIGDRDYWGRGIATLAIRIVTNLAFEKYGIRKLSAGIYSDNIGSIKAYSRAGWIVEAVLYDQLSTENGLNNHVLIACFNPRLYNELPDFPLLPPEFAAPKKA